MSRRHAFTRSSTRPGGRTIKAQNWDAAVEMFDVGMEVGMQAGMRAGARRAESGSSLVDETEVYLIGYSGNLVDSAPAVEPFTGDLLRAYLTGVTDRADWDTAEGVDQ